MIIARKLDLGRGWVHTTGADSDVVICSRVRLGRNFSGYPFVDRLTDASRGEITRSIGELFADHPDEFCHLPVDGDDDLSRMVLRERCLDEPSIAAPCELYVRSDQDTVAALFDHDHLRIVSVQSGRALRETLINAEAVAQSVDQRLPFAVSLHWGYVGPDPRLVGAGLNVSVLVHLPALMDGPDSHEAFVSVLEPGVHINAFRSDNAHSLANVYQLECGQRPGLGEDQILGELEESLSRLVHYERQARDRQMETRRDETKISVERALSLLRTTAAIRADEALQLLSWIRLGVALGLTDEITMEEVTMLLFLSQKSHLMQTTGRQDDENDRRAHLLRRCLSTGD